MSTQTIKQVRKKRGMTQADVADSLDVSRNIIIALEKGTRELTMSEAKKLSELLGISVTSLSDDQYADFEKYQAMILWALAGLTVGDGKIPKTKLAKMLYLADFTWFYHEMESMSGMSYRKIDYGPVPDEYFRALEDLEQNNLIDIEINKTEDGYKAHLVRLTEGGKKAQRENELLKSEEKELIGKIVFKWEPKSTADIVGFTHQQLPYKIADEKEIISYALVGQEEEADLY